MAEKKWTVFDTRKPGAAGQRLVSASGWLKAREAGSKILKAPLHFVNAAQAVEIQDPPPKKSR